MPKEEEKDKNGKWINDPNELKRRFSEPMLAMIPLPKKQKRTDDEKYLETRPVYKSDFIRSRLGSSLKLNDEEALKREAKRKKVRIAPGFALDDSKKKKKYGTESMIPRRTSSFSSESLPPELLMRFRKLKLLDRNEKHIKVRTMKDFDPLNTTTEETSSSEEEQDEYDTSINVSCDCCIKFLKSIWDLRYVYAWWECNWYLNEATDFEIFLDIAIFMFPILLLALIWDICATFYFNLEVFAFHRLHGLFWPIHAMNIPFASITYAWRRITIQKGARTSLAFIFVFLHFILFVARIYVDYLLTPYRYGIGLDYEKLVFAMDDYPYDYDPNYQYPILRWKRQWKFLESFDNTA